LADASLNLTPKYFFGQEREAVGFLLRQELGKAKSDRKKEQAKAAIKSFDTMVKYCEVRIKSIKYIQTGTSLKCC
jgi:hypothetical protein